MTSRKLFIIRLKQNWKYQFGHIKTILDWTIWVYLVIPTVIIGAFIYRSWWIEIPGWAEVISFPMIFAISFLFLWRGHFQTYVRDADRIFVMKNERLLLGLKQAGIIYSYAFQLMPAVLIGLLMAPFWLGYLELELGKLILFVALWLSMKWVILGVKGKLNVNLRGWRSLLRGIPIFIGAIINWIISYYALNGGYVVPAIFIMIIQTLSSYFLVNKRFTSVKTFEQDLAIDELEKDKYIGLIFGLSMDIEKLPKPATPRKSPLLYSKSNRLFRKRTKRNGFLELFIKVATRNVEYILRYLQILGVTSAAVSTLPPIWLKIAIAIFGYLFLLSWTDSVWQKIIGSHPFTTKYAREDSYFKGRKAVKLLLTIPYAIMIVFSIIMMSLVRSIFPFF